MKNVKITVLRKQLNEDLAERYLTDGKDVECAFYQVGDTFLYTGGAEMPEGFSPGPGSTSTGASQPSPPGPPSPPGISGTG